MARYDVNGKVALVTGSARGIGFATAKVLHERGATVVLTDLDQEATENAAASISAERTMGMACDVTDRGALNVAVSEVVERFGGLDIVVANAGVAPRAVTVRAMGDEEYSQVMAVNIDGVWNTVRAALPQIVERKGHVVVVSSVYAFTNGVGLAPYAIAKAAVEQLGRALRYELSIHGAGASTAYFGFIDTKMVEEGFEDELGQKMLDVVPNFLLKKLQPSQAGEAITRGIERRSPTILVPRRWRLMKWTRGFSDPVLDRLALSSKTFTEIIREADARDGSPR